MRCLRLTFVFPLFLSACCSQPPKGPYTLDQVIAATIHGVRKGVADGAVRQINPATGLPYDYVNLEVCGVAETWAISSIDTKTVNGSMFLSGAPVAPAGFSFGISNSTTNSIGNQVVVTWSSPLCPSGAGGSPAGAPSGSPGGKPTPTGAGSQPHPVWRRDAGACPAHTHPSPLLDRGTPEKPDEGYECLTNSAMINLQ